ncbi:hypothetical protein [Lacipirellula sp.]|uniref:hypothetical protein n=1 Tax=Lacipirellula sp. TaxID=2691419 RepID=UPI003D12D9B5
MHEVTSHKVNGLNEAITVNAIDIPGDGNANHEYRMASENFCYELKFQKGPIGDAGPNGLSNEVLLAIVEDRLIGFQAGKFACRENAVALTKLQEALMWLHKRTRDRVARGVEGKSQL